MPPGRHARCCACRKPLLLPSGLHDWAERRERPAGRRNQPRGGVHAGYVRPPRRLCHDHRQLYAGGSGEIPAAHGAGLQGSALGGQGRTVLRAGRRGIRHGSRLFLRRSERAVQHEHRKGKSTYPHGAGPRRGDCARNGLHRAAGSRPANAAVCRGIPTAGRNSWVQRRQQTRKSVTGQGCSGNGIAPRARRQRRPAGTESSNGSGIPARTARNTRPTAIRSAYTASFLCWPASSGRKKRRRMRIERTQLKRLYRRRNVVRGRDHPGVPSRSVVREQRTSLRTTCISG